MTLTSKFFTQLSILTNILDSSDTVASDASKTATFKGHSVSKPSLVSLKIKQMHTERINKQSKITPAKLLQRICTICDLNDREQTTLEQLSSSNKNKCATALKDLVIQTIHSEQYSHVPFYHELQQWVAEGDADELRVGAANAIIQAYQNNAETLDLDGLDLKSLPEVIKELHHIKKLFCEGNRLTQLPDIFKHLPNLKEINLSKNTTLKQFPKQLYDIEKDLTINLASTDVLKTIITPTLKEKINDKNRVILAEASVKKYQLLNKTKTQSIETSTIAKKLNIDPSALLSKQLVSSTDTKEKDVYRTLIKDRGRVESSTQNFVDLTRELPSNNSNKLRGISCGTEKSPINIFGCMRPSRENSEEYLQTLSFIYNNADTVISLTERNEKNEPFTICKDCAGTSTLHPVEKTFSIPILDFQPPRLEHYLTLSEEINTPLPDGAPKGILFFCGFGEGRTGTLLAAGKVMDEFNKLDTTARKQLLNLDREYTPDNYNGIFSYLNEDFKTTPFVGKIVQDLRQTEYESALKKGISVETPAQF